MSPPVSNLAPLVIDSLREHPHDDTPRRISARLDGATVEEVFEVLEALRAEALVMEAEGHWQLTGLGWRASH